MPAIASKMSSIIPKKMRLKYFIREGGMRFWRFLKIYLTGRKFEVLKFHALYHLSIHSFSFFILFRKLISAAQ